jgi:hypothetical protein
MPKKEIPGTSIRKAEPITATTELQVSHEPTPMDLISMAISKDMDIEKLEKLMGLQERWKAQVALQEFNLAFSKFQSIVPDMSKNRNVSYASKNSNKPVNYNYQDLGDIGKNIKGALSECGLSYNWETEEIGDDISVFAVLKHSGGHEVKGKPLKAKADASGGKEGLHAKGSTITFLKRYTLTAILGLTTSEPDDDGHAALKSQKENPDLSVGDDACPMIKDDEYKLAMKNVMNGEWTVARVLSNRRLLPTQHQALETAEKAAAAKKA